MHLHNNKPILIFENIQVHSKRTASIPASNDNKFDDKNINDKNMEATEATTSALSTICQRWIGKLRPNTVSQPIIPAHQRLLIDGATGKLLAGQVTVLTGASGSGKSVLLRVLAGLLPMSGGNVCLRSDDQSTSSAYYSIHDTAPIQWRTHVALLAQHPQLLEGSVLENLQMPYQLQAHQHRRFDIDWHIAQLEQLQRSADFLQQEIYHLSGGERQLVNTLRLLQLNPRVLLLDEPTAALDGDTSAQLVNLLMNWLQADSQRTLLWVTHDTKDIMPLADQHWQMQAGILTEIF